MESGLLVRATGRRRVGPAGGAGGGGLDASPWLELAWRLYPIVLVCSFPFALLSNFWLEVWRGVRSRATDGSGHWGVGQIYSQHIFPDTFGWTGAYFAGMPFPNYYPPLFHWLVGLLEATGLLSFGQSFKLALVVPTLAMPAAVWLLARRLSGGDYRAATAAAAACVLLLVNMNFQTSTCGLDYTSTFVAGFYTQPLGFVLLLAWFAVYLDAHRSRRHWAASSLLLALTVLANFFNALTGALLVAAALSVDASRLLGTGSGRREAAHALVARFTAPLAALGLCLFWLVPMFGTYQYFVTRPLDVPLGGLVTPWLWLWYAVAAVGIIIWLRRPTGAKVAFLFALAALALCVVSGSAAAPSWLPLQAFRFFSTLNFLLSIPVGVALAAALDFCQVEIRRPRGASGIARHAGVVFLALLVFGGFQAARPTAGLAFYGAEDDARIESVLRFAREHRDGRYLVEALDVADNPLVADGPALNAYLGAQGNETLGVVYREASPNSLFFNAQVNAFSTGGDSFGISSVLADDLDFAAQPLSRHIERARWLGVKYLVVEAEATKQRLAREEGVGQRHDLGRWSVFELQGRPAPHARALPYRPALVVSGFSAKSRRRNEFDFLRLAQEQFHDGWFDVLLARAPDAKVDRLTNLEAFGALVLDTYDCDDEARAYALLRDYAAVGTLILLESDAPLYRRIRSAPADFPRAHFVARPLDEDPGERVESFQPAHSYVRGTVRRVWGGVRRVLEREKVASGAADETVGVKDGRGEMTLARDADSQRAGPVPVLIQTTYSPNWRAHAGEQLYAATPFFTLAFVRDSARLEYSRGKGDRAALWASALTLLIVFWYAGVARKHSSAADGVGAATYPARLYVVKGSSSDGGEGHR